MRHALVVRLDSLGDMVICGPAIRAVSNAVDRVTVLAGPLGAPAARLLPGVDAVEEWRCPWILNPAPPLTGTDVEDVVGRIRLRGVTEALILTSFHQSALPMAVLLRLAGVYRIAAISEDYPGSLLDVRIAPPLDAPEPVRMLAVARAAGYELPPGDEGRLAVRHPLPTVGLPFARYIVAHPGGLSEARSYPRDKWCEAAAALTAAGRMLVVTGGPGERELADAVAAAAVPGTAVSVAGELTVPELAAVLAGADVVVIGNTGPAHLAAAVGVPIVSLFAPVVPALRWAPFGAGVRILGDQQAPCAGTRKVVCPIPGHPCLTSVTASSIAETVDELAPAGRRGGR